MRVKPPTDFGDPDSLQWVSSRRAAGTSRGERAKKRQHTGNLPVRRDTPQSSRKKTVAKAHVFVDAPNVNSWWHESGRGRVPQYGKLPRWVRQYLQRIQPDYRFTVIPTIFANSRETSDLEYIHRLREAGWQTVVRPKVGDSDIDENITQYVQYCLAEETNLPYVFFVGNDLKNFLPLMRDVRSVGGEPILICSKSNLSSANLRDLQGFQVESSARLFQ